MVRRGLIALAAAFACAATAAGAWWVWPSFGDPLAHLPTSRQPLVQTDEQIQRKEGRVLRRIAFDAGALGAVRILVSLPDPMPADRLPALFVLGGLRTGKESIRHVEEPGGNALIGFDYPIDRRAGRGLKLLLRAPELRQQVFATPGQIAAALEWVRSQPWADPQRVTPVGVSLGALFLPAALRLDQARGRRAGHAVIAYGGAGIALLTPRLLRGVAPWLHAPLARAGAWALRPIEPAEHLPHLVGAFLLLGSADADAMVPAAAARLAERLTPEPKTIIHLPGGHVGGETEVTRRLVATLRAWLSERGAVAP